MVEVKDTKNIRIKLVGTVGFEPTLVLLPKQAPYQVRRRSDKLVPENSTHEVKSPIGLTGVNWRKLWGSNPHRLSPALFSKQV